MGTWMGRDKVAINRLMNDPHILALTKNGHPRHPLYLKKDLNPIRWDEYPEVA